jgi:hypothetical protein
MDARQKMSRRKAVRPEGVPMKDLATNIVLIPLKSYYGLSIHPRVWERRQESEGCCNRPPNSLTLNYLMNGSHWRDATEDSSEMEN